MAPGVARGRAGGLPADCRAISPALRGYFLQKRSIPSVSIATLVTVRPRTLNFFPAGTTIGRSAVQRICVSGGEYRIIDEFMGDSEAPGSASSAFIMVAVAAALVLSVGRWRRYELTLPGRHGMLRRGSLKWKQTPIRKVQVSGSVSWSQDASPCRHSFTVDITPFGLLGTSAYHSALHDVGRLLPGVQRSSSVGTSH